MNQDFSARGGSSSGGKKIEKIVINVGLGRASSLPSFSDKFLPSVIEELSIITGQKPQTRPAKQSIAGFKLRAGTIIGLKVTLRKKRMRDFFQKLVNVVLPRVRDFRGIKYEAVDSSGNLTIGIKEYVVFPEVNTEIAKANFGLEVTIVPRECNREKAIELYKSLGIPFSAQGGSSSGGKNN